MSKTGATQTASRDDASAVEEQADRVFKALSHRTRRAILDALSVEPLTTGTLCAAFPDIDRCTVMQHLGVLVKADLVIAHRRGRERWNHLNVLPIKTIHDRWIGGYATAAVALLADIEADDAPQSAGGNRESGR